ncbi:MAG: single-stranded DNA-binding protein [Pseudonocardia sp.]|nr:single-stranded DNA-binding protein [Pseudonocardia sp.]
MSGFETTVTITGNLGDNPHYFSKDGSASAVRLSVGFTPREFDRRQGEWVDRPTVWHSVVVFGQLAENVNATLTKGSPVIVIGKFRNGDWVKESREVGVEDQLIRRTDIRADYVGLDLNKVTAEVTKNPRRETATAPATTG